MEEQIMSMPPVWLGLSSRTESFNNPFAGQAGTDARVSGNRMLYIPDRSLALFDQNGTFEDIFGKEDGLAAPQLTAAEYKSITDQLLDNRHAPYQLVTDRTGSEQLIVLPRPVRAIGISPWFRWVPHETDKRSHG